VLPLLCRYYFVHQPIDIVNELAAKLFGRPRVRREGPAKPPDRTAALSETVELLHRIFQAVDLFSRKVLRDFGVSGPQVWALRTIASSKVVSMGALARRMHLHMSTVTGIIDRLEAGNLVIRERSARDARIMELRLTSKGRAILARAPEPPRSKAARRLGRLPMKDLRRVQSALHVLARAMDVL
jgi:DNA-binding MarR family transcriptional regulator